MNAGGRYRVVEMPLSALDLGGVNREWVAKIGLRLNQGDGTVYYSVFDCAFGVWWLGGPGPPGVESSQWRTPAISAKGEDRSTLVYI